MRNGILRTEAELSTVPGRRSVRDLRQKKEDDVARRKKDSEPEPPAPVTEDEVDYWTPNQVVAFNLARIREMKGLDLTTAAATVSHALGVSWSDRTYAQVERSVTGAKIRQFTADDLVSLAWAYNVPVGFFLTPPPLDKGGREIATDGYPDPVDPVKMLVTVFGTAENRPRWQAVIDEFDTGTGQWTIAVGDGEVLDVDTIANLLVRARVHRIVRYDLGLDPSDLWQKFTELQMLLGELAKHEVMYVGTDDEIKDRIRQQLAFRDKFNGLVAEVEDEKR